MKFTSCYFVIALLSFLGVALRVAAMVYIGNGLSGNPVDIYYVDGEATSLVLGFQNPYLFAHYLNHYGGIVTFAYLPMIPLYFAPFLLGGIDIRYGSMLADLVTIGALYYMGKATLHGFDAKPWMPYLGAFAYALLPTSIWLTGAAGTNMMIGSMFLAVALVGLLEEMQILAGVFLGLGLATNQFVILAFPVIAAYYLRRRELKPLFISISLSLAIALPFLLFSYSQFLYDVLFFQLERPFQPNGLWSLSGLVYAITGIKVGALLRVALFAVPAVVASLTSSKTKTHTLIGVGILSSLGGFVLPSDGFWNYFLIPSVTICALIPLMAGRNFHTRALVAPEYSQQSLMRIVESCQGIEMLVST